MSSNQRMAPEHRHSASSGDNHQGQLYPAAVLIPFQIPRFNNLDEVVSLKASKECLYQREIEQDKALIGSWLNFALTNGYIGRDQLRQFLTTSSYQKKYKILNNSLQLLETKFKAITTQYNSPEYIQRINGSNWSLSLESINEEQPVMRIAAEALWVTEIALDESDPLLAQLTYHVLRRMVYATDCGSEGSDIVDFSNEEYLDDLRSLKKLINDGYTADRIYNEAIETGKSVFDYIECYSIEELDMQVERLSYLDQPHWYDPNHPLTKEKTGTLLRYFKHYQTTPLCLTIKQQQMLWFCQQALKLIQRKDRLKLTEVISEDDEIGFYYPIEFYHQIHFGFGLDQFAFEEVSDYANNTLEVGYFSLRLDKDSNHKNTQAFLTIMAQGSALVNFLEEVTE